jgi:hypothetical protein
MLLMLCPSCGHHNKVKGFCTRCGLNLALLPMRNATNFNTNINAAQTVELNKGVAPSPVTQHPMTQSFDAAQTQALTPRVTMAERATTRLHEIMVTTTKRARPYISLMLAATTLVFIAAVVVWRSVNVPTQNVAYAAAETVAAPTPAPTVTATPAPLWAVIEGETQSVTNAAHALIKDQQFAVIEPNGQLALTLTGDQFFGNDAGADVLVHGASERHTAYRIFVRDNENTAWQRIDVNRKGFAQGTAQHDMGHHGIVSAQQLLIRNDSACALHIDDVAAAYLNLAMTAHSHRH